MIGLGGDQSPPQQTMKLCSATVDNNELLCEIVEIKRDYKIKSILSLNTRDSKNLFWNFQENDAITRKKTLGKCNEQPSENFRFSMNSFLRDFHINVPLAVLSFGDIENSFFVESLTKAKFDTVSRLVWLVYYCRFQLL